MFGLLTDVLGADVRQVKLTDEAIRIVRDPRAISPERDNLIRGSALRPRLHLEVITKYQGLPPSDEALRAYLMIDRGLKDEAVPDFVREFSETMAFAKIANSDAIQDVEQEQADESDQVETGAIETADPKTPGVIAQQRSLASGSDGGIASAGMRREIFALDEGDVTLTYPAALSADSYSDLEAYLRIFLKKAARRSDMSRQRPENDGAS
ncbi:MAG: hypothetical protein WDN69_09915 [Aliidongia sp.]